MEANIHSLGLAKWLAGCLGQENLACGFVDFGEVRPEMIPDGGELEVCDQADGLLVVGVGIRLGHSCPERPGLIHRIAHVQVMDRFHTPFDDVRGRQIRR